MQDDKPLRDALIGCGFFALNQLRAWQDLAGVEIVALCDSNPERLAAFAAHHPYAAQFTDAQAMSMRCRWISSTSPPRRSPTNRWC